jgi:predicted RNA binding protein YcfA (HicA-like mRNA interferase family)
MRLHDLERVAAAHGLTLDHVRGSHRVYRTADGRGRLVAAVHVGRELHRGEVKRIRRDLARLLCNGGDRGSEEV